MTSTIEKRAKLVKSFSVMSQKAHALFWTVPQKYHFTQLYVACKVKCYNFKSH